MPNLDFSATRRLRIQMSRVARKVLSRLMMFLPQRTNASPSIQTRRQLFVAVLMTVMVSVLTCSAANAQWTATPMPIGVDSGAQRYVLGCSDGAGGIILVWSDGPTGRLKAQRISHDGTLLWNQQGVVVSGGWGLYAAAASDGQGGVLVAWTQGWGPVGAQRLDPDGRALWGNNGAVIPAEPRAPGFPGLVADGSGGGIIAWYDRRGSGWDVYASRVSSTGTVLWAPGGLQIRSARCDSVWMSFDSQRVSAIPDGGGGALLAWTDCRSHQDIYAQRVDSSGVMRWTPNGVRVTNESTAFTMSPIAVSDDAGGMIAFWLDPRIFQWNLFAQRIDSNGNRLWPDSVVIAPPFHKYAHAAVSDGQGGALVFWTDYQSGLLRRYGQRFAANGAMLWDSSGVDIGGSGEGVDNLIAAPTVLSDGARGAIVSWARLRGPSDELCMQRVDESGRVLWDPEGVVIANNVDWQWAIAEDGDGGAIAGWGQGNSTDWDVFAQRIAGNGGQPPRAPEPKTSLVLTSKPNPARGPVMLTVRSDRNRTVHVSMHDLQGRMVRDLGDHDLLMGFRTVRWDGLDSQSRRVTPGVYLARFKSGAETWSMKVAQLE